jgi:hypothetical protein
MPNYSLNNAMNGSFQAITAAYKTLVQASAATVALRRGKIYDVMFGTLGTPADQTYEFDISRTTTIVTGSTSVAVPLDPADGVASTIGTVNFTAEPTYTGTPINSVFNLGINQRASYRWVAAPGSELLWPATNLNGLGLRTQSVSGGSATATGQFLLSE